MRKIGKTAFFEAARMWRVRDVAAVVREQPELVSLRDASGRTALHRCAAQALTDAGRASEAVATARALLAAGADVNAVQPIQDAGEIFPATALWYALAWGRNRRLGSYLLSQGADPNNCMFAMVFADDLLAARLLRRHGARIDEVFHAETPLIYAMRHRRARFGEWLLSEGADFSFEDGRGLTALHHAVRRRLPDSTLLALIKHGADLRAVSRDGVSVGQLATRKQRQVLGIDGVVKSDSGGSRSPRESPGFEPVAGPDARILILGTLPGAVSLAKGEYYAQPRNAFWRIMAEVADAGPGLPYDERKRRLIERRLALWDVCASAMRPGSLDSKIRIDSIRPNDVAWFLASHPDIQLICFNGAKAAALFRRLVLPKLEARWSTVRVSTLPSTSAAHAAMPLWRKVQLWRATLTAIASDRGIQSGRSEGL